MFFSLLNTKVASFIEVSQTLHQILRLYKKRLTQFSWDFYNNLEVLLTKNFKSTIE
jgi:hypothetical protein